MPTPWPIDSGWTASCWRCAASSRKSTCTKPTAGSPATSRKPGSAARTSPVRGRLPVEVTEDGREQLVRRALDLREQGQVFGSAGRTSTPWAPVSAPPNSMARACRRWPRGQPSFGRSTAAPPVARTGGRAASAASDQSRPPTGPPSPLAPVVEVCCPRPGGPYRWSSSERSERSVETTLGERAARGSRPGLACRTGGRGWCAALAPVARTGGRAASAASDQSRPPSGNRARAVAARVSPAAPVVERLVSALAPVARTGGRAASAASDQSRPPSGNRSR